LRWTFDPLVILSLSAAAFLYVEGVRNVRRRHPRSGWPRSSTAWYFAGLAMVSVALVSPIDYLADRLFWVHMVQHVLLMMVAAPFMLLGRPITLALMGSSPPVRKRVVGVTHSGFARALGSPLLGLGCFAAVLWVSHFSWVYDAALTNNLLHAAEHLVFLLAALLFWWPVVARDPGSARLSYPARLLYLFLAMPVMSLLGLVITMSNHVLYAHYRVTAPAYGMTAMVDQGLGGTIMWASSMVIGTLALSAVLIDWMERDDKEAVRMDERRRRAKRLGSAPIRPDVGVAEVDPRRA
jgi:putative membrane protein